MCKGKHSYKHLSEVKAEDKGRCRAVLKHHQMTQLGPPFGPRRLTGGNHILPLLGPE